MQIMTRLRSALCHLAGAFTLLAAACFGNVALADNLPQWRYVIADVGSYGAAQAKCAAQLEHMAQQSSTLAKVDSSLRRDGHGFLQARADDTRLAELAPS